MNKIIIPTLLIATVIAVGFFAFSPVEQASTVHTTITNVAMIPFIVDCAEILLAGGSDDGEITLDVTGNNPIRVTAIYFESGGEVTDGADFVAITEIRVDTVTLGQANNISLSDTTFAAFPTEGEILGLLDGATISNNEELIATTDIGVTVDGTVVVGDIRYTLSFAGYRVSGDTAPTCDITGVT